VPLRLFLIHSDFLSFQFFEDHLPFWNYAGPGVQGQGVINVINLMAPVLSDPKGYSGPYGWADADFLELGARVGNLSLLTQDESKTEFASWVIFNSPLIFAADPRTMTWELEILMNKELLAVQQDFLMKPGQRVQYDNATNTQAWAKPLSDGSYAWVIINADSVPHNVTVSWSSIGWGNGPVNVSVRDLWAHADLTGNFTTGFTATNIPVHGNAAIRVTKLS
jgi:alpha-galactosidase